MNWLPLPADFRTALREAKSLPEPAGRVAGYQSLARNRLSYMETIQLDRALTATSAGASPWLPTVRLALVSTSTVDHLAAGIRVAGLRHGLRIETYIGQYGQYRQEILDRTSSLHAFAPQVVLLSLTARDILGRVPLTASLADAEAETSRYVEELSILWRSARETLRATVIQQTFLNTGETFFGSHERQVPGAPTRLVARLNDLMTAAAAAEGVLLLDVARASERDGLDAWHDVATWLQGKLEIAPRAAPAYGELAARIVAAQRGLSRKCLVLDLDNTLWGGVVGDDGVDGIVLGEGTALGEAHLSLQRYARQLRERGVILAVCSKNDPEIAMQAFGNHPEMHLKPTDIAAFVANWNPKPENLKLIAQQLNIGLDSLVFVDDNPAERAAIRQALPMVAVPELPSDPAQYVRCVSDAGYFEAIAFTAEDRTRGDAYAANVARDTARSSSGSLEDFLRGLNMSATFGAFATVDLARVAQLINKTNQFNTTTRRHTLADVTGFAESGENITLQIRLVDTFGDNGLIAAMILRPVADRQDAMEIDTWVMSCRVFGRQLEFESMNVAVELARGRGIRQLYADYIPTAKNGVIQNLFPSLGFTAVPGAKDGVSRWTVDVETYQPTATHIRSVTT